MDAEGRLAALGLAPCRGQIGKSRGRSRDPDGEAAAAGARTQHRGKQRRAHGRDGCSAASNGLGGAHVRAGRGVLAAGKKMLIVPALKLETGRGPGPERQASLVGCRDITRLFNDRRMSR